MKLKIQAQHLQPGDIVGSGEVVVSASRGIGTPVSKVDIWVEKDGKKRYTIWGKYTTINVERQTSQEKLESDFLMREGD